MSWAFFFARRIRLSEGVFIGSRAMGGQLGISLSFSSLVKAFVRDLKRMLRSIRFVGVFYPVFRYDVGFFLGTMSGGGW